MRQPRHPNQLRPGHFVRDFRIVSRLGVGGFAFVFLVERGDQRYAMKMAARPVSAKDADRVDGWMRREVAAIERLNHPAFQPVLQWGRWPDERTGYSYFVTPYVRGRTFHVWRWRHRVSLHRAVGSLAVLAWTLEVLHARGVCHRDLKADNVLVGEESDVPFLIDFGSSHLPGALTLTEGIAPGTLYCQPPEVISFLCSGALRPGSRMPALPSADLYALGVLLYETLTDCRPFDSRLPLDQLLHAIATMTPVDPRTLEPSIPDALAELTLSLLEKDPQKRPPSAGAVRSSLEQWLAEAPDSGPWRELGKRPSERAWDVARPEGVELLEEAPGAVSAPLPSAHAEGAAWRRWLVVLALVLGGLGVGWMLLRMAHPPVWREDVLSEATAPASPVPSDKGTQPVPSSTRSETSLDSARPLPSRWCALLTGLLGVSAAQSLGCASVPKRQDPVDYLARCSAEARATPVTLNIKPKEHPAFFTNESGTPVSEESIEEGGAFNIKPGPVSADMLVIIQGEELYVKVMGTAETWPQRVYAVFDRLQMPDGRVYPICGVAIDGRHQYGIATWQKFAIPNRMVPVDVSRVDTSPGSVVLNDPRFEVVLQGPEGYAVPRVDWAPPDWR
ncbi:protein kinase domain-containing protein [Melittangium boletus]|uniref:Protein kinase domain-containing protein n=1 Tax=Melittangium boletus DSM 14713 TaxID=1294270 RepID=A0A250IDW6_9BACT|nr:protein kinase [Melittangium boletus]ATB29352.1 hypothetical protein MEBOL_002801 [Melittangium boletus DSM 14713]